jgi:hypothetical protein
MIVHGARLELVHVIKSQKQSKVYQYDGKSSLQNIALRISPFLVLYFLLSNGFLSVHKFIIAVYVQILKKKASKDGRFIDCRMSSDILQ